MDILTQIENYRPYNEQEERDKGLILDCLRAFEDVFTRENALAHMTASAWVVNERFDRVLMAYHNIYDSWSWLGGHADGDEDLLAVALKEVREESGVKNVRPASEDIFSLEVLTVDGHMKRGKYVSSHLHLNVTYLLIADDTNVLTVKPDENSGVKWFTPEGAVEASSEKWFREHVYNKLNEKMRQFYAEKKGKAAPWRLFSCASQRFAVHFFDCAEGGALFSTRRKAEGLIKPDCARVLFEHP